MANISEVIEALKQGKHARRAGWNGKRMHIYMEEAHNAGGGGMRRKYEPSLVLFTAQQTHQPGWNASTPDLLATDWEILEPHETDYPREMPRSDTDRLNWLEDTKTAIGYNVENQAWGVDFDAPYGKTIREGIDAGHNTSK